MKSSFFEFSVAISGLSVARSGLNVTSNNVSNASNKGYSRQYIEQRAARPMSLYTGKGMVGTGAEVYGIGQMRSGYLDKKFWHETSVRGEYSMKNSQLNLTETIFSGMSDTGMTGLFDSLFQTIQDLTQNSSDDTYRTNVITSAETLAKQINNGVEALKKQQQDINSEVNTMVSIINSLGSQITSLNKQISKFEIDGSAANDLRDQRVRLVDELSKYINVEVREEEFNREYELGMWPEPEDRGRSDKRFSILINGEEFVNHFSYSPLRIVEREEKLCDSDVPKLSDIYFANSNKKLDLFDPGLKGELKGLIDMRDGNNSYYARPSGANYDPNVPGDAATPPRGTMTLTGMNKNDIGETGYIELTDPLTGARTQYKYTNMTYDHITGEMTLEIEKPANYTGFDTMAVNAATAASGRETVSIGRSTSYKGIPHYINRLNELVRTFARAMNEGLDYKGNKIAGVDGHVNGYDAYNSNQGTLMFSYDGAVTNLGKDASGNFIPMDYSKMTAENFQVCSVLTKNPKMLAASDKADSGESNNNIILQFIEVKNARGLFLEGKISDYISGMTGELGIDTKQATNFNNYYYDVVTSVDNQRMATSGVDVNEEMVMMTKYQQLYQAAAKLVNVIDSIYDTCINRLGVH